jgi:dCTP deaminase
MVLSDSEILKNLEKGDIQITPFNREYLNPNSVDLTLGDKIKWYQYSLLDCKKINPTYEQIIPETGFVLAPNKVYLAACNEKISIYNNI